jgi:hypothetical protein
VVSFHTVLTRMLVITLDLALSTWPAGSTCTIQRLEGDISGYGPVTQKHAYHIALFGESG